MNILIITPDYPYLGNNNYVFVKQVVERFVGEGHNCTVIAPFSVTKNKHFAKTIETRTINGSTLMICRPNYFSFSTLQIRKLSITELMRRRAVRRVLKKLKTRPDVVYTHFWCSALDGVFYCKKNGIPLFVASGESTILQLLSDTKNNNVLRDVVTGVICVSSKNKEESIKLGLTTEDKCVVIPNAIDNSLFKEINQSQCRARLDFNENDFIVSFVGWFNDRKGSQRVSDAIKSITDTPLVKSIFIGSGPNEPDCPNILYKGAVPHDRIPIYLNASDVFVLPTLNEGCCNAVVEALACGLPVVSSDRLFNKDILDSSNSILIEPNNIEEIAAAIKRIRDDAVLRSRLKAGAIKSAQSLTLETRVKRILRFIIERKEEKKQLC